MASSTLCSSGMLYLYKQETTTYPLFCLKIKKFIKDSERCTNVTAVRRLGSAIGQAAVPYQVHIVAHEECFDEFQTLPVSVAMNLKENGCVVVHVELNKSFLWLGQVSLYNTSERMWRYVIGVTRVILPSMSGATMGGT